MIKNMRFSLIETFAEKIELPSVFCLVSDSLRLNCKGNSIIAEFMMIG